jgi:hypothetical protein
MRRGSTREMKGSIDADGDHAIPKGSVGFPQAGEDDQSGIVNERIDPPEAVERDATESATDRSKPLPS